MEQILRDALDFSNYNQTLSLKRKHLKEKNDASLTFGYNGGIFKIDRSLLLFTQMLIDQQRPDSVILDVNDNPILIENLQEFRDKIFEKYFTTTYNYYTEYQKIKKSRTIDSLVDL